jgi:putative sigma-54 modulation protein
MMQVNIRHRGEEVNPSLREFTEEKVAALSKFAPELHDADVELRVDPSGREGNSCVAEALLRGSGKEFRASASANEMFAAVDLLSEKLKAQLTKYHQRSREHRQKGAER